MGWNPANWAIVNLLQGQNTRPTSESALYGNGGQAGAQGGGGGGWGNNEAPYVPTAQEEALLRGTRNDTDAGDGYGGGSGSGGGPSASQVQIDQINRLLGNIDVQAQSGIGRLDSTYNETKRRFDEDQSRAMQGYDKQATDNERAKQRGVEQVDNFANQSYNTLMRLFQGGNSGNSSAARLQAPQLVSKAAGQRRTGVFDTAGENAQNIDETRKDAEIQFGRAKTDTDNQYNQQKESFLSNIEQQKLDLLNKRLLMQQQSGAATAGTQSEIDQRTQALNALFGQFAPSFNVAAPTTQVRDLASYQVDPAQVRGDQNLPAETRYYSPILKKRQQQA